MPIQLWDAVNFTQVPTFNFVVPALDFDPPGYTAGLIYNKTEKRLKYNDGTSWVSVGTASSGAVPSGPAGGDLTGTYPNPQIAPLVIVNNDISATAEISQSKIEGLAGSLDGKVDETVKVIAGVGLVGGGQLTQDITIDLNTQAFAGKYVKTSGDVMTGSLNMSGSKILMLPDSGTFGELDAAPVWFVLQRAAGLSPMQEVRAATTDPISLTGLPVIDGVRVMDGDRVLVKDQHNRSATTGAAVANGIYIAKATGPWVRSPDASAPGSIVPGSVVSVTEGLTYDGITFAAQIPKNQVPWQAGVTDSYWMIFTSRVSLQAGDGLVSIGNTINIVPSPDGSIIVTPNTIRVEHAPRWSTAQQIFLNGQIKGTSEFFDGSDSIDIADTVISDGVILDKHVNASAAIKQSKIEGLTGAIGGMVPVTRQIIAGNGLTGGGSLSDTISLHVAATDATVSVGANGIAVASAPKWTTARSLTLEGGVAGTATLDGSGNVTMQTTVVSGAGGFGMVRKFAGFVGAGTTVPVVHNLATRDIHVQVHRTTSPYDVVDCGVEMTDTNTVTLRFATTVVANAYRVVVQG